MADFFSDLFAKVLGPGLVAALVSAIISGRFERNKATRDYITKLSDGLKDDIRKAVEAGVVYVAAANKADREKAEANVQMYEGEIRSSVAALKESCILNDPTAWNNTDISLALFIDALTGGDFGSAKPKHKAGLSKRIAGSGSALKMEVTRVRRRQLQHSSLRDFTMTRAIGLLIILTAFGCISFGAGVYLALVAFSI